MTNELVELTERDHKAMQRAFEMTRNEDDAGRREQVEPMFRDDPAHALSFASYHCQVRTLKLKPWESPPSCIPPHLVDGILKAGREHRDYAAAKLVKQLLDAGLSQFEPDPAAALKAAGL